MLSTENRCKNYLRFQRSCRIRSRMPYNASQVNSAMLPFLRAPMRLEPS